MRDCVKLFRRAFTFQRLITSYSAVHELINLLNMNHQQHAFSFPAMYQQQQQQSPHQSNYYAQPLNSTAANAAAMHNQWQHQQYDHQSQYAHQQQQQQIYPQHQYPSYNAYDQPHQYHSQAAYYQTAHTYSHPSTPAMHQPSQVRSQPQQMQAFSDQQIAQIAPITTATFPTQPNSNQIHPSRTAPLQYTSQQLNAFQPPNKSNSNITAPVTTMQFPLVPSQTNYNNQSSNRGQKRDFTSMRGQSNASSRGNSNRGAKRGGMRDSSNNNNINKPFKDNKKSSSDKSNDKEIDAIVAKYSSKINQTGDSAEEIAAWIAERKARYPTAATMAKRQAERQEQSERGELLCDAKLSAADEARQRHNRQFERCGMRGRGASRGSGRGRGRGNNNNQVRNQWTNKQNEDDNQNENDTKIDEVLPPAVNTENSTQTNEFQPDKNNQVDAPAAAPIIDSNASVPLASNKDDCSASQAAATTATAQDNAPAEDNVVSDITQNSPQADTSVNADEGIKSSTVAAAIDVDPLSALPDNDSQSNNSALPVNDIDHPVEGALELATEAVETIAESTAAETPQQNNEADSDSDSAPAVAPLKSVPDNYAIQMELKHNFNAARLQAREEQINKKQSNVEQEQQRTKQREALERAPPVCRDWMLNSCSRGDECSYSHSAASISAQLVRQQIMDQRQANSLNKGNSSNRGSRRGGRGGGFQNRRQQENPMDPLSRLYLPKPSDYILRDLIAPQIHQEKSELLAAFRYIRQHNFLQPQKQHKTDAIEATQVDNSFTTSTGKCHIKPGFNSIRSKQSKLSTNC